MCELAPLCYFVPFSFVSVKSFINVWNPIVDIILDSSGFYNFTLPDELFAKSLQRHAYQVKVSYAVSLMPIMFDVLQS